MRIATWNINSIKVRLDRVLRWLDVHEPDALCLQELKVTDDAFPAEAIREAGYHAAWFGQRAYNGVAILCREEPEDVGRGMGPDDPDDAARLVAATVGGVRVLSAYFPNGQSVGSPKYDYKLAWMDRLRGHLDRAERTGRPLVLAGDFNVAPRDSDVARLDRWDGSVLTHPSARAALEAVRGWGLEDVFAAHHPDGGVYSWWDYQRLAFPKNDGLRIDHLYATPDLARRSSGAWVDREARKKQDFESKPSDHAPVVADFD